MKVLLDTHVWLWSLLEPARLGPRAAAVLSDPDTEIWLSPISTWEVLLLAERGRVVLDPDPVSWIRHQLARLPFRVAAMDHEVAIRSRYVNLPHPDPADRFLAATAQAYDLTLVTADDRLLGAPGLRVLPAA